MGVLDRRVAVVTGASRGIGQRIAARFAAEGAAVAVVARTEEPSQSKLSGTVHETVRAIRELGGTAIPVPADLSRRESYLTVVPHVEEHLGPIDILVHNAGLNSYTPFERLDEKRYRLMFEVMVHAPTLMTRQVVAGMRQRRQGWILGISSKQARLPAGPPYDFWAADGSLAYGMCKAALEKMCATLAAELWGTGVRVNALGTAGLVETEGALLHPPKDFEGIFVEPPTAMPDAALALCSGPPEMTGRVTYSLEMFGAPELSAIWGRAGTLRP